MNKYPCVLVAEISVINTLKLAVNGLIKYSDVSRIDIIVPDRQYDDFKNYFSDCKVQIIEESELISFECIEKIKHDLGDMAHRFGWYLQQFLKWQYAQFIDEPYYLIWDADTVLLEKCHFFNNTQPVFNLAKENHKPYFNTIQKLIGISKQIKQSFISQYMVIDVILLGALIDEIMNTSNPSIYWYLNVIKLLDKKDPSEFSEYETYGNYIMSLKHSNEAILKNDKWFRYGSEILIPTSKTLNRELEQEFIGYQYVAFERHESSCLKKSIARIYKYLRV